MATNGFWGKIKKKNEEGLTCGNHFWYHNSYFIFAEPVFSIDAVGQINKTSQALRTFTWLLVYQLGIVSQACAVKLVLKACSRTLQGCPFLRVERLSLTHRWIQKIGKVKNHDLPGRNAERDCQLVRLYSKCDQEDLLSFSRSAKAASIGDQLQVRGAYFEATIQWQEANWKWLETQTATYMFIINTIHEQLELYTFPHTV